MNVSFLNPYYFLLLLSIPIVIYLGIRLVRRSAVRFSSISILDVVPNKSKKRFFIPHILRIVCLVLIIFGLARLQLINTEKDVLFDVVDMMFVLDVSRSMQAEDFQPANRLEVAKEEAIRFIDSRKKDRIGLVIFAQSAITQCPLTTDHRILKGLMDKVQIGTLKGDGTAIGIALGTAINRLRDSDARSKLIILLTDGENNAGQIDPITAAELAKSFNIKVYTIGVGKGGKVPFPFDDPLQGRSYRTIEVKIDEKTLRRIADITDGVYFRARDEKALREVYAKIDALEKTEVKMKQYLNYEELYHLFLYPFLILFFIEIIFTNILFLKLP